MSRLANPRCPACLRRFARNQLVTQVVRSRPAVRVGRDGSVCRFREEVAVTCCDGCEEG